MVNAAPSDVRDRPEFDVEALRNGIEGNDADTLTGLYTQSARLTLVDRREQPSHPFQVAGRAAIGDFVGKLCEPTTSHRVDQVVVSDDGSRAAYLERCRYADGTRSITTSMLDLADGRIAAQISLQSWDHKSEHVGSASQHARAAAEHVEHLDFTRPDEVHEFPRGRAELLNLRSGTVGRLTFEPLWRWSRDIRPAVGTEWCEVTHFLYHLSGTLRFHMADGTEFDAKPGDVTLLPPGHDAWVVGSEAAVVVDWQGAAHYGEKKEQALHSEPMREP